MARIYENQSAAVIRVSAPAKINLTLEVLGKRGDGYHEIRSVMQTISLADTLIFREAPDFKIESDSPGWEGEKSLVSRTASLLKEKSGTDRGAHIFVEKKIPLMSGLGGDSSNAAATLLGLNRLWGLRMSPEVLTVIGAELGSDVAFFFHGGTALAAGRGEIITPLPSLPRFWALVFMPEIPRTPGKTKQAYQGLRPDHFTGGEITSRLITEIQSGRALDEALIYNTFENTVFPAQPELRHYREHLLKIGVTNLHLAGSGYALFSVFHDREKAVEIQSWLKGQNLWCELAESIQ